MKPQYPLVFSTLLIRLGIGVLITWIVLSLISGSVPSGVAVSIFAMCCVLTGVILSMTHLGRPKRFLNAFANLSSMLTWEAILTPLLLASASLIIIGLLVAPLAALTWVGKIGALIFGISLIYVTAKVYHLKVRPSWATPLVVYEFFVSALCMGILGYRGLLPFLGNLADPARPFLVGLILIGLIAELVLTLYYRHYIRSVSATGFEALREKTSTIQFYLWIGLGLAIPFVLSGLTLMVQGAAGGLVVIAFISFFFGAMFWRIIFFKIATPLKITPDIAVAASPGSST